MTVVAAAAAMDAEPGARIWARQQSERVERAAGRKARLAEGVRSVFMQRLGGLSLPEAFAAMDVNGDGILSIDEFKKGLRALKIGLMPWEVGEFVSVVDSDLSGSISQAEFIDMFSMPVVAVAASAPASAVATSGEEETSTAETNLLPGARLGARPGAVVDRELWERLDTLESTSAAIVDPDEYGSYSRADALDDEALVLVRPDTWSSRLFHPQCSLSTQLLCFVVTARSSPMADEACLQGAGEAQPVPECSVRSLRQAWNRAAHICYAPPRPALAAYRGG